MKLKALALPFLTLSLIAQAASPDPFKIGDVRERENRVNRKDLVRWGSYGLFFGSVATGAASMYTAKGRGDSYIFKLGLASGGVGLVCLLARGPRGTGCPEAAAELVGGDGRRYEDTLDNYEKIYQELSVASNLSGPEIEKALNKNKLLKLKSLVDLLSGDDSPLTVSERVHFFSQWWENALKEIPIATDDEASWDAFDNWAEQKVDVASRIEFINALRGDILPDSGRAGLRKFLSFMGLIVSGLKAED